MEKSFVQKYSLPIFVIGVIIAIAAFVLSFYTLDEIGIEEKYLSPDTDLKSFEYSFLSRKYIIKGSFCVSAILILIGFLGLVFKDSTKAEIRELCNFVLMGIKHPVRVLKIAAKNMKCGKQQAAYVSTNLENETKNIEDIQIDKGVDDVSNDNYFSEKKRPKLIINDEKLGQMFCDDFNKHRYNFLKEFLEGLSGKNLKIIYGRIALKIYEKSQGRQYILRESIRDTSFPDYCKFFFESIGLFVKIPDRNTCNRKPLPVEIDTDLNKLLEPTIKE